MGFSEQYGTPVATPGIAEKGLFNMQLEVRATGGHSSVPPPNTVGLVCNLQPVTSIEINLQSIGILAALLVQIESNPFEARLVRGPVGLP